MPLVCYRQVKAVNELAQTSFHDISAVHQHLGDKVEGEQAKTEKFVDMATRVEGGHGVPTLMKLFNRVVTYLAGIWYSKPDSLKNISTFSIGMGIGSVETIEVKDDFGQKRLIYHGPRHLFGRSVHEYRSINEWFVRDLTPKARQEYTAKAKRKEQKLHGRYGKVDHSLVVITGADSRTRVEKFKPGEFGKEQRITGKVLNDASTEEAKKNADNPNYYSDKYSFTTKNLLGRENSDPIELKVPKNKNKEQWSQKTFNCARKELLGEFFHLFNREGAVQCIQRLAPADIHNYVAPLDGKPLSQREAAMVLKQRLEAMESNEKQCHRQISHLEQLIAIFTEEEMRQNGPSPSTIVIKGTNSSVACSAVKNRPCVLAQNDRKMMLYLHNDGSFSLHVFIGATGVNGVDVETQTEKKMVSGERMGDMRFGKDSPIPSQQMARGDKQGQFPINGSTVISYYLLNDFTLLPEIEEFKDKMHYREKARHGRPTVETDIEIKAQMGDPLLIKTEIRLAEALKNAFPVAYYTPEETADDILGLLETTDEFPYSSPQDQKLLKEYKDKRKTPSYSDGMLHQRLRDTLNRRSGTQLYHRQKS